VKKHICSWGLLALLLLASGVGVAGQEKGMANHDKKMAGHQMKPAEEYQVEIKDFAFKPATLAVKVGEKVTWSNRDDEPHQIGSVDKKLVSPVLDTDGQFSQTFTSAGTYEYYCTLHPKMTGKVVVK
jgi:amicyanin